MRYVLLLFLLFFVCCSHGYGYREPHGVTARGLIQAMLLYAEEHDGRLPENLTDLAEYESIVSDHIAESDIFYLAPSGATWNLHSTTPIILIRFERDDHEMHCIGYLGGNVSYFTRTGHPPRPGRSWFDRFLMNVGQNPILSISVALNMLLLLSLGYAYFRST